MEVQSRRPNIRMIGVPQEENREDRGEEITNETHRKFYRMQVPN